VGRYLHLVKESADGRVMVDLGSFAKMNPDYLRLKSAKPPTEVIRDNKVAKIDITRLETRMFAPAIVYGFSFRLKKWGCFSVRGFSKIYFNTSAFDGLVMDADTKEVVENLVRKQLDAGKEVDLQDGEQVDSIASKGEGSIILCHGPPGTGKTLTAESLSEKLRCHLWCLSISELGTTPATLETMLLRVMDVAASWGALLLLDEADIFLERRTTSDLKRNAMTGVFLRQLEYYRGVLFLTTNRDLAFDDAMCSRISLFLHYGEHNEDQRKTIWTRMFERVGLDGTPNELAEFAKPQLNGREIRNIIKTAHTLSRSKGDGEKLEINHIRKALKVYEASMKIWRCNHEQIALDST
jgi:SpoVK/Ycf46/Vps4 family AAA+-type ATPase